MNRTVILLLIIGTCFILPNMGQDQEELATLKKQVTVLKNKNALLEKSIKDIKRTSNAIADTLNAKIETAEAKINATSDTLRIKEKLITNVRKNTIVLFNALKHRKKLVIIAIIIGALIIAGISYFIFRKYSADRKKYEEMLSNMKRILEDEMKNSKSEFQSQLNTVTGKLEEKNKELDQKIKDQEKKINELKK